MLASQLLAAYALVAAILIEGRWTEITTCRLPTLGGDER
jgi:hypothetical protein